MSAPCKDTQKMAGTNFSLEGEQAGRQCDITCNCRMLLTHSVYLLSSLGQPNLNSRMLKTHHFYLH